MTVKICSVLFIGVLLASTIVSAGSNVVSEPGSKEKVELLVDSTFIERGASSEAMQLMVFETLKRFKEKYPHIDPKPPAGLVIPGQTKEMLTMMEIAGDIAPDVMAINFRRSDTYIQNKFLYPLDKYIEKAVAADIPNGHLLGLDDYLTELKKGSNYQLEIADRVPYQCWMVMRRQCPYGDKCPIVSEWGCKKAKKHFHTWCFPEGQSVVALSYRRDFFGEAGLPDRAPRDWEEMLNWARKLTNPKENRYGINIPLNQLGWGTLSFLYSMGGKIVDQDEEGEWICTFDSNEAVEAYYFAARLFLEPFENEYGRFRSVVDTTDPGMAVEPTQSAMRFTYLDQSFFKEQRTSMFNFGPVPFGPTGKRGSEFNSSMAGIYAGLEDDKDKRDAAWEFIRFFDGSEARMIQTRILVEKGMGRFVQPALLRKAGYEQFLPEIPEGWEETSQVSMENGIPEPYGKNCQMVYQYVNKGLNQIILDKDIATAIKNGDKAGAKERIRIILKQHVRMSNAQMLGKLTPQENRKRTTIASAAAGVIFTLFALLFRQVFRSFSEANPSIPGKANNGRQFGKYKWAYIFMAPAIGLIALWMYYPLARGTVMAFQDYNVRGFSDWVGMTNFGNVLFNDEFWYSLWVSLKYTLMFMVFGFIAPIVLAFLLTEVPKGKILFRTIYYLPTVLTGVVVIFLWKGFYGPYGMINQILNMSISVINPIANFLVNLLNYLPAVQLSWSNIPEQTVAWLQEPRFALFFCLLPTIWAGMGPGCLIYLAALKTIPEDLYEAADIDGAGIRHKIFHIAVPGIRALIAINFIGAIIGAMRAGGSMVLAMTGGGPYTPYGETEMAGLHIFYQAFGYLKFGNAVAMAWVLGSILVGFTVLQLKRLSRLEFRTAKE